MRDARPILIALLLATPFACSHDERGAASPTRGSAGNGLDPAPATTEEPNVPGVPSALNGPSSGRAPSVVDDSRTTIKPNGVAQPRPFPGSGGTIGTGGTNTGGLGPGAGTGGISTGGSIVR